MSKNLTGYADPRKNQGYWAVGDRLFPTKVQAILEAQKTDTWPTFHYNDQWWDSIDWSKEPEESLDDLYLRRAKQLRDQYDTLILRFSGGGDSMNILRTFVDNNIPIDAIVVNEWTEVENLDPETDYGCMEKRLVARPMLDDLEKQGYKFDRLQFDLSRFCEQVLSDKDWWWKTNTPRFRATEMGACRAILHPNMEKYNRAGTALILGLDKPVVRKIHNKIWSFVIPDDLPCLIPDVSWTHITPEPFYWTADLPELPCKQGHVAKNFLKNINDDSFVINDKMNKKWIYGLLYGKSLGMKLGDELPFWQVENIIDHHKTNDGQSPRNILTDRWIENSRLTPAWREGIDAADRAIKRKYKKQDHIWDDGLVQICTKPRWLGK